MSVERHTFKIRRHVCSVCGSRREGLAWDYDQLMCCGQAMVEEVPGVAATAAVIGDEIDWVVRHGPCHEDGSPRRFRSRAEWRKACEETGWTPNGDTPKTREERHRWV